MRQILPLRLCQTRAPTFHHCLLPDVICLGLLTMHSTWGMHSFSKSMACLPFQPAALSPDFWTAGTSARLACAKPVHTFSHRLLPDAIA
jgi:hypothetical protein